MQTFRRRALDRVQEIRVMGQVLCRFLQFMATTASKMLNLHMAPVCLLFNDVTGVSN